MKYLSPAIGCLVLLLISGGLNSRVLGTETTVDLYPVTGVTTWSTSSYRWKDIATNTYAQSYKDNYDYANSFVEFTYDPTADSTLTGHLSATNLKPNFAYQLKLVGKPTALWGAAGDDTTNERLGFIGRWWRNQPNPGNSDDADYLANHDEPGYVFEGYLVFAFFITDLAGNAEKDIAIDSSFHVLWWEHQRTPGDCDSPVLWSTVIGHASHPAYAQDVGPTSIGVYAEIERNCTGTTTMPEGLYDCRLLLTEESFHQSGPDEGNWQSVLVNDTIAFEIDDLTPADAQNMQPLLITEPVHPNPFLGQTVLRFALARASQVSFTVYDLSGRLIRHLPRGTYQAGEHQIGWDGRDDTGHSVASGVYVYRLEAGSYSATKRMVLVK